MNYTGIVENGQVRLPPSWKDGTPVRVEAVDIARSMNRLTQKIVEISAKAKGLPADFSSGYRRQAAPRGFLQNGAFHAASDVNRPSAMLGVGAQP